MACANSGAQHPAARSIAANPLQNLIELLSGPRFEPRSMNGSAHRSARQKSNFTATRLRDDRSAEGDEKRDETLRPDDGAWRFRTRLQNLGVRIKNSDRL